MFDHIFQSSDALRRQYRGPLREARLAYLRYRAEQGAPLNTLRKLAQYMLVFTERLSLMIGPLFLYHPESETSAVLVLVNSLLVEWRGLRLS